MSFTVAQVKDLAQKTYLSNAVIHGDNAIIWIDELIRAPELSRALQHVDEYELVADENQWYSLPPDLRYIVDVLDSDDYSYKHYAILTGKIRFANGDTFRIHYVPEPRSMVDINQEIPLSDTFRHICAKYLAAQYLDNSKDKNDVARGMRLFQEVAAMVKDQFDNYDLDSSGFTPTIRW